MIKIKYCELHITIVYLKTIKDRVLLYIVKGNFGKVNAPNFSFVFIKLTKINE